MSFELEQIKTNNRKGPCVLLVLDGVGIGKKDKSDAFHAASPEFFYSLIDEAKKKGLYAELYAHGTKVGLPTDGDMGNSEVGHNALGSGQIYSQGAKLVNESLESGAFFQTEVWSKVIRPLSGSDRTVHFIGLLSDGNIHSNIHQLFKMVDGCVKDDIRSICFHVLLDGRDVAPTSGLIYIDMLEKKCNELNKLGVNARIASGGGRMGVTMDRYYSNWKAVEIGWNAHVHGKVETDGEYKGYYTSAQEAIEHARHLFPEKQDQFNPPFVIVDDSGEPVGRMRDHDVVINFNFRGDRAIEISEAFEHENFSAFDRGIRPAVQYVGLLEYDGDRHLPAQYLVPPPLIENVSSQYLCHQGIRSYAIAETHKYGHVTYFWNGNRSGYIDESLERFVEIKSDPNEMIESKPEMKAKEVSDALIEVISSNQYDYIRANIANGDMVGHTGNFESCIKSVKILERELKRVVDAVLKVDGVILVTADHGNIEQELDKNGTPLTSHTLNKVPLIIIENKPYYKIKSGDNFGIANVIATTMNLMGFKAPDFYEQTLIEMI